MTPLLPTATLIPGDECSGDGETWRPVENGLGQQPRSWPGWHFRRPVLTGWVDVRDVAPTFNVGGYAVFQRDGGVVVGSLNSENHKHAQRWLVVPVPPQTFPVGNYTAFIDFEKRNVKVGCQTFDFETVTKLAKQL